MSKTTSRLPSSGNYSLTLRDLKRISLRLTKEELNALRMQGTPMLAFESGNLELRVVTRTGVVQEPTVHTTVSRGRSVVGTLMRLESSSEEPNEIKKFLLAKGVVQRTTHDRAATNLAAVRSLLNSIKENMKILKAYMPSDFDEKAIRGLLLETTIPHVTEQVVKYCKSIEIMSRQSFVDYFIESSYYSKDILIVLGQKMDPQGRLLKKILFPKRITKWFSLAYKGVEDEKIWKLHSFLVAEADKIRKFVLKGWTKELIDAAELEQEQKALENPKYRKQEIRIILPPNQNVKEYFPSRNTVDEKWAPLRSSLGSFQAWNIGLLSGHLLMSGLRNGIRTDTPAEMFYGLTLPQFLEAISGINEWKFVWNTKAALEVTKSWGLKPPDGIDYQDIDDTKIDDPNDQQRPPPRRGSLFDTWPTITPRMPYEHEWTNIDSDPLEPLINLTEREAAKAQEATLEKRTISLPRFQTISRLNDKSREAILYSGLKHPLSGELLRSYACALPDELQYEKTVGIIAEVQNRKNDIYVIPQQPFELPEETTI